MFLLGVLIMAVVMCDYIFMFFICGQVIVDKLLAICGQTGIKTSPSIYNLSAVVWYQ